MTKRVAHVALSSVPTTSEPFDFTGMLFSYCAHARDAAAHGRFQAAHGLFQTALLFYDRVEQRTKGQCGLANLEAGMLIVARGELDSCANFVYPVGDATEDRLRLSL